MTSVTFDYTTGFIRILQCVTMPIQGSVSWQLTWESWSKMAEISWLGVLVTSESVVDQFPILSSWIWEQFSENTWRMDSNINCDYVSFGNGITNPRVCVWWNASGGFFEHGSSFCRSDDSTSADLLVGPSKVPVVTDMWAVYRSSWDSAWNIEHARWFFWEKHFKALPTAPA